MTQTVGRSQTLPAPGELHVWHAWLERPAGEVQQLGSLLSADERGRADRFRFERDRSRYTVGRGLLRTMLGRYLNVRPVSLVFEYGAHEKPHLRGKPLWFNVAHSGPVALFAFTAAAEVGIDVELDDADFARERIAERFFSPAEVRALRSLPPAQQPRAFLTCWTRKEAFIKARGDGLSLALDSFDVSLRPGAPAALLRFGWGNDDPGQWCLRDLSDPEAGYVAAVAIRTRALRLIDHRVAMGPEQCIETRQEET